MKLAAYLEENGESAAEFAERAGISKATAFRVKSTGLAGSLIVIRKITEATGGLVNASDLAPDEFAACKPKRGKRSAA